MSSQQFQRGDHVVHPRRPEWGRGVIKDASAITHKGVAAQRVSVQFANKGRVVINTAVAPLEPETGRTQPMPTTSTSTRNPRQEPSHYTMQNRTTAPHHPDAGWLNELEKSRHQGPAALAELPDTMTDPFVTLRQRLDATLESYRFSNAPRSLIDWAVMQTGLKDPLSEYTRHELEEGFERFRRERDQQLKSLVKQILREGDRPTLDAALKQTRYPEAKTALSKAMR